MSKSRIHVLVLLVNCALVPTLGWADPPVSARAEGDLQSREEVIPGVPLDGSIVIDESLWVSLTGEPGAHMERACQRYVTGKMDESAASVQKASSFLAIASNNALKGQNQKLRLAAAELAELHDRLASRRVNSEEELKSVFGRAHLALSRHHAVKSAQALKEKKWALASNYLRSSASHFQQASHWSGVELQSGSKETIVDAKQAAKALLRDKPMPIEEAGRLIESLGQRIEKFGKSLAEQSSHDSDAAQPTKNLEKK